MKITKKRLKQLIMDELQEMNIFHDSDGMFSDQKQARSTSGPGVGQNEYPSGKDKRKCGTRHPSRKHCKKVDEKIVSPVLTDELSSEEMKTLKHVIASAIKQTLSAAANRTDCSFSDLVRAQTIWAKAQAAGKGSK